MGHCWLETNEEPVPRCSVLVQHHDGGLRFATLLQDTGELAKVGKGDFIIYGEEAKAIGRSVMAGECPAGVLADWIEDHIDDCEPLCDRWLFCRELIAKTAHWIRQTIVLDGPYPYVSQTEIL